MWGFGLRTSLLFLGIEESVLTPLKRCVSRSSKITKSGHNKP